MEVEIKKFKKTGNNYKLTYVLNVKKLSLLNSHRQHLVQS